MSIKDFSVLTVSKRIGWKADANHCVAKQTAQPFEWIVIQEGVNAPKQTRLSNLNASLNEGLRQVTTDYVIFYQDFIELPKDCFEKLLALVDERTFVTTCTPNYDGSSDSRYTGVDEPRRCRPEEWETNVAIAPMKALRELGGFDTRLDTGWSWDNALLARKAAMLGYKFIIDESNRPKLYPHEMSSHETLPLNNVLCEQILLNIRNGKEEINCHCI